MSGGFRGYYSIGLFRSSLVAFAAGRVTSAVAGFVLFLLLARSLPIADYGQYLTLLATLELVLLYASLGIPWIGIRFLPEFRIRAAPQALRALVGRLALFNGLALALALLVLWPTAQWWTHWLNLDAARAVMLPFLAICAADGISRFATTVVLESLLAQRTAQLVQILRNLAFLAALGLALTGGRSVGLQDVVMMETLAATLAAITAVICAVAQLRRIPPAEQDPDWQAPDGRTMAAIAWYNYSGNAVANLYSHSTLQLLANALLGPNISALFGFARSLADQVRRYLPSEFLLSVIRPMLVASYATDGDHRQLNRRMLLGAKFSLIVSAPVLGLLLGAGPAAVELIGGSRLQDTYWLVVALLFVAFSRSHRSLLGLYVNCVRQTDIWLRASLWCLFVLPLALALIEVGWGAFALVAAMIAEEIICTASVLRQLSRRGLGYSVAIGGLGPVIGAAIACAVTTALALRLMNGQMVPVAAALGCIAFGVTLLVRTPFDAREQQLLNRVTGRPLFGGAASRVQDAPDVH
ncbi:MAG TPA: oligosaccharide flippase family protein [Burkholderiaceae bacterium]|jgi:O-antigen/teichoic acid export membrane protein|nr:oligosaccharide flippase family protein [Burkholderiaceae bacterium]